MKYFLLNSLTIVFFAVSTGFAVAQTGEYTNRDLLISAADLRVADPGSERARLLGRPLLVIDVREPEDYAEGHIPGAVNITPDAVAAPASPVTGALRPVDEIALMLAELGLTPAHQVVFYDDKGGFHAARMFWLAEYLGHANVSILNGGLSAWAATGGTLETGHMAPAAEGAFVAAPMPRRRATADWVLAHREDENVVVIDVRPAKLFEAGHIPWAKNIPWSKNLNSDGTMKSAADLRDHFEAHGVEPEDNIVIHCEVGLASSHSYFALRLLGHPRVRVYHRSWAEWGADPALPRAGGS